MPCCLITNENCIFDTNDLYAHNNNNNSNNPDGDDDNDNDKDNDIMIRW